MDSNPYQLQQYLPFTVLKHTIDQLIIITRIVATVLTVYGIETLIHIQILLPFLRHRCNSTYRLRYWNKIGIHCRLVELHWCCNSTYRLRYWNLQENYEFQIRYVLVATVLTVYGIETYWSLLRSLSECTGCNSTYRLRYVWWIYSQIFSYCLHARKP